MNNIRENLKNLSNSELLSEFMESSLFAIENAEKALSAAGGLRALVNAVEETAVSYGLKEKEHYALNLALEIATRYLEERLIRTDALTSPGLVKQFLQAKLRDLDYEVFACLLLDNQHRVIKYVELFRGTIDGASVYPREVVKATLAHSAAAVILVHNHPSGIAEPSSADRAITERLKKALDLVDIRVLDHLIVGDGYCESFAERGII